MANIKSSKRFFIKSEIQRKYNASNKSKLRTFIKKVNTAIKKRDKILANNFFTIIKKIIDQHTVKGLIHKNKAARYKSNIFKNINKIDNVSESNIDNK